MTEGQGQRIKLKEDRGQTSKIVTLKLDLASRRAFYNCLKGENSYYIWIILALITTIVY